MKCAEIRDAFLKYFERNGHTVVPSSSLVPANDPTLLFTNAGMVQFKDVFLGLEERPYKRAVSSQRCVRAGGKHNDLENVGYTARHHTFFEMLGNFSFGDYFKEEAIHFAWQFLTQELKIPEHRLWVTVHVSDDEAADIWLKKIGVDPQRFSRLDEDNFWQMGDTGPCGPCSEIFYDHGEEVPGGPPGSENDDLDRYIEVWNLVFMQYERQADGNLVPLPKPSVDTGMGLERIAAVMQAVHSNYEIDLFQALLKAALDVTGTRDPDNKSLRVIADHIRSCAFLICDGVVPSNEGRGYVVRRIIRRAIRHGHKLGKTQPFFYKLVTALVEQMGAAYPELAKRKTQIEKVLLMEEEQFAKTLEKGLALLNDKLNTLSGDIIPGDIVFKLYDTYGFPVDLTNDIARERNLKIDGDGYEKLMEGQRRASQEAGAFKVDYTKLPALDGSTEFVGYTSLEESAVVGSLLRDNAQVATLAEGEEGIVVLDRTPFYGESGGQIGDSGYLHDHGVTFEVRDCQKLGTHHLHLGRVLKGSLKSGMKLKAVVDREVREAIKRNHSATHLLHAALRKVLGDHVTQKGSLVDSEKLRFDFSHLEAVTPAELDRIAGVVNAEILKNTPVQVELCDMESAKAKGAMALFGEKYGDVVRVLTMGDGFSVELCGGTHVNRTGDIALLKIESETGIAAGIRRIEAVTGAAARASYEDGRRSLENIATTLKSSPSRVGEKVDQLVERVRELEKSLTAANAKLATLSSATWVEEATAVGEFKLLVKSLEGIEPKALGTLIDQLKNKLGSSVVVLASTKDDKIALAAGVTKDLTKNLRAGDVIKHLAPQVGGKGGGRPDFAQGAGADIGALPGAMESVAPWIRDKIGA